MPCNLTYDEPDDLELNARPESSLPSYAIRHHRQSSPDSDLAYTPPDDNRTWSRSWLDWLLAPLHQRRVKHDQELQRLRVEIEKVKREVELCKEEIAWLRGEDDGDEGVDLSVCRELMEKDPAGLVRELRREGWRLRPGLRRKLLEVGQRRAGTTS